ncbi:hypothetical protein D3C72_654380 [compost metagenome]
MLYLSFEMRVKWRITSGSLSSGRAGGSARRMPAGRVSSQFVAGTPALGTCMPTRPGWLFSKISFSMIGKAF